AAETPEVIVKSCNTLHASLCFHSGVHRSIIPPQLAIERGLIIHAGSSPKNNVTFPVWLPTRANPWRDYRLLVERVIIVTYTNLQRERLCRVAKQNIVLEKARHLINTKIGLGFDHAV